MQRATAESGEDEGWVNFSSVKPLLPRDFDVHTYGFATFKALLESEPRLFEITATNGGSHVRGRLSGGGSGAGAARGGGGGEGGGGGAAAAGEGGVGGGGTDLGAGGGETGGGGSDPQLWKWSEAQDERTRRECDAGELDSTEQRKAFLPTISRMEDADVVPGGMVNPEPETLNPQS